MVQSPSWAANWLAASQEIPGISRNPKVHYRTHKRPPPVSIPGQPNPVHIPTSHLLEIRPNIIHPSTPRSPQWSLSLRFPHQDPIQTRCTNVSNLFYFGMTLYMFRTVFLSIIRSTRLYIQTAVRQMQTVVSVCSNGGSKSERISLLVANRPHSGSLHLKSPHGVNPASQETRAS